MNDPSLAKSSAQVKALADKLKGWGKFIVIEGLNHSGKSSQSKFLVETLEQEFKIPAFYNKNPTARVLGRVIRNLIDKVSPSPALLYEASGYLNEVALHKAMICASFINRVEHIIDKLKKNKDLEEIERQLLFLADRMDDIINIIDVNLMRGRWVIQDRFDLSTFSYGISCGIPFATLRSYHKISVGSLGLKPDLLIFIDLDEKEAMKRLMEDKNTTLDIYESLPKSLKETRANYLYLLKYWETRSVFCSEENAFVIIDGSKPIDEVKKEITLEVAKRFSL